MKFLHYLLIMVVVLMAALGITGHEAQAQDGPRTLTDALGREVTIETPPQNMVGLSASITEMLYAIGATPIGATEGTTYPEAASSLPTFGTGYELDLEALAALAPDLIIANAQLQADIVDQLEAIAPTFYVVNLVPSDIPANLRLLGQVTWHDTEAEMVAHPFESVIEMAQRAAPADGPSVMIIIGTLELPFIGTSDTYLGSIAEMLGATNVAGDIRANGPFPGFAMMSVEDIIVSDPDVILTITRGAPGSTPLPDAIYADPLWSEMTAAQNGRVYELDNILFLQAPGMNFPDAFLQLWDILYSESE